MLGTGLGPAAGVSATDNSTTSLGGTSVTIGGVPAILLYVSSTQINFAVPLVDYQQDSASMQVTVNGVSSVSRQIQLDYWNPHMFINTAATYQDPTNLNGYFVALALNADGSVNSSSNPAQQGSTVSVFLNGVAPDPQVTTAPLQLNATNGWTVEDVALISPFVWRVDLREPSVSCGIGTGPTPPPCGVNLGLSVDGSSISPPSGTMVWVKQ